ncbi:MAG: T9SS type A sorting domain-containing protein [Chitinophagales bacterium]|nr:T9SS type A sorting domain-containing protein [Chitinophagales bacterium]
MYPNPAQNYWLLQNEWKTCNATLYQIDGSVLSNFEFTDEAEYKIDAAVYPSGIYYLKVHAEQEVLSFKLIKQ